MDLLFDIQLLAGFGLAAIALWAIERGMRYHQRAIAWRRSAHVWRDRALATHAPDPLYVAPRSFGALTVVARGGGPVRRMVGTQLIDAEPE